MFRPAPALAVLFTLFLLAPGAVLAQGMTTSADDDAPVPTAPVVIDGHPLFTVRGVRDYPAYRRAADIQARIVALARDRAFVPESLTLSERPHATTIGSTRGFVMHVTDADADLDGINRRLIAEHYLERVQKAIVGWRASRTKEALSSAGWRAGVATALVLVVLLLQYWVSRLLRRWETRLRERAKAVSVRSFELLAPERISAFLRGVLRAVLALTLMVVGFLYVQYVLGLFPWTCGMAAGLRGWVLAPLLFLGRGFVAIIPNLIFIVALVVVFRYALQLVRLFFQAVGRGDVTIPHFYPEWAAPTFNILRLVVIAFAVVVAYPYIPGASSDAFKGVSIFMAAIFSLSSTSVVSNVIAGYALIYRRVFHEGDLVKVGDVLGFVTKIRLQVTHLRTAKNEEVVVPNSTILTSNVVNYNALAQERGLILHTTVGIGYETPWRQVEALLLAAAARTPGLLHDPPPFVLQSALDDFAVKYQINGFCEKPGEMMRTYSALHANILDLFNEHGVQIMTPAYEGDPAQPKVVPPENWHLPPATLPEARALAAPGTPRAAGAPARP